MPSKEVAKPTTRGSSPDSVCRRVQNITKNSTINVILIHTRDNTKNMYCAKHNMVVYQIINNRRNMYNKYDFSVQSLIQNAHKRPMVVLVEFTINLFADQPETVLSDCAFFGKTVNLCVPLPVYMIT